MRDEKTARAEILKLVNAYARDFLGRKPFDPGKSRVNYAGRVFDEKEIVALVDASLDSWITMSHNSAAFEKEFAQFLGTRFSLLANSGSSANLVAFSSFCSPELGDRRLKPGDEVITPALTFPTTLAPIALYGMKPVFLDVEPGTYDIRTDQLEDAISPRTRAIVIPHTLGNPCQMDHVMEVAKKHNLFVMEDTCDALDSKWDGKKVGTFGDVSTCSFYAAHHMTMGEGGAIAMNSVELMKIARSMRDWGRACWCPTGEQHPLGACRNRFGHEVPGLPKGYDHKYTYTHIGYNLKPTDIQAAVGRVQLKKLPEFTAARKKNFARLYATFSKYEDCFILPRSHAKADASWFSFPLTVKENSRFKRDDIIKYLEGKNIETRMIFSGNILNHPGYADVPRRIVGDLRETTRVMEDAFFIGLFPGISEEQMNYVCRTVDEFMAGKR